MRHLIPFRIYESIYQKLIPVGFDRNNEVFLNRIFLNRNTKGTWRVNPSTGLVDIRGDFRCYGSKNSKNLYDPSKGIKSFMGLIKFGSVTGNFTCFCNKLRSLEGAPKEVSGNFYFRNNGLRSLEGSPQKVGGSFNCSLNELQSLKGAPKEVGMGFNCSENQLQSLKGAPKKVGGVFNCSRNELQSLEGAPKKVGGVFNCSRNQLQSLEGAPQEINGRFFCDEFELIKGKWNMKGWLEVLEKGSENAQKLILTLPYLQPDSLNLELQRNPGKVVLLLAQAWKHMPDDLKSKIKIPKEYEDQFGLFTGFFETKIFKNI